MFPALFLDRDGVIIENRRNYVRSWEDVEIFEQALSALVQAARTSYKIVIVTNQSAIGRGLLSLEAAEEINRRLVEEIEKAGGRVDAIYLCPHSPYDGCDCRKPRPGLIIRASKELSLDLSRSILVGDALSDIQAGQAAGIPVTALVRTGLGAEQAQSPEAVRLKPFPVYGSLTDAVAVLL